MRTLHLSHGHNIKLLSAVQQLMLWKAAGDVGSHTAYYSAHALCMRLLKGDAILYHIVVAGIQSA